MKEPFYALLTSLSLGAIFFDIPADRRAGIDDRFGFIFAILTLFLLPNLFINIERSNSFLSHFYIKLINWWVEWHSGLLLGSKCRCWYSPQQESKPPKVRVILATYMCFYRQGISWSCTASQLNNHSRKKGVHLINYKSVGFSLITK